MLLINTLLTLLLSEATGVNPTPLLLLLLDALVVVPFMWVKGGELWHAENTEYKAVGKLLRFFAILNAAFILRFVIGLIISGL
jgi:hypothetical protein